MSLFIIIIRIFIIILILAVIGKGQIEKLKSGKPLEWVECGRGNPLTIIVIINVVAIVVIIVNISIISIVGTIAINVINSSWLSLDPSLFAIGQVNLERVLSTSYMCQMRFKIAQSGCLVFCS